MPTRPRSDLMLSLSLLSRLRHQQERTQHIKPLRPKRARQLYDNAAQTRKVVSLFSGCGGLDYGFASQGFQIVSATDHDEVAVECYNRNHATSATISPIDEGFRIQERDPEMIIAGPPCQGFSTAGGYKDRDERNSLLQVTCRLIAKARPRLAIIENVSSLTNKRNVGHLREALSTLGEAGFYVNLEVYSAHQFGVPQKRKRTVILARRGKKPFQNILPEVCCLPRVKDALKDIPSGTNGHNPKLPGKESKHAVIARKIGGGQKLCNVRNSNASVPTWDIPELYGATTDFEREVLQLVRTLRRRNRKRNFGDADPVSLLELKAACPTIDEGTLASLVEKGFLRIIGSQYDLKNTFNGKYRRLEADGLSPTVDTRFGDIQLFLHPWEDRGLTVREAARLQGFPDTFHFPKLGKAAFRMIGNAVPPPMSMQIAQASRELLK
jgi:DNA (cytosine-5)-methyltransferase 1